jgi:exonuclease III
VPPLRLRVACWNLRHGGGNTRTPEQALFLISHAPDIVMLSEYRESRGDQLRAMLSDHGLAHSLTPDAPSTRNRVAILSRWALLPTHQAAWRERLLSAKVTALGIDLIAAHVPDESAETRRASTWQGLAGLAKVLVSPDAASGADWNGSPRVLIAGDFNTARTGLDAARPGQTCERWMGALATAGYRDCVVEHARARGQPLSPTWFGPMGEEHRIDGIWASSGMLASLQSASQDASCVTDKLSDHALIVADFAIEITTGANPPAASQQAATGLFSPRD